MLQDVPTTAVASDGLTCPLCSYDLRGLAEERCPECGFGFTWAELLDERRDRHPWLFEHGRDRLRRLAATWRWTPFARRFWLAVTPANPVRPRRLVAYWALANAPLVGLVVAGWVAGLVAACRSDMADRAAYVPVAGQPGQFASRVSWRRLSAADLDAYWPRPWTTAFLNRHWADVDRGPTGTVARVAVVTAVWPWLTVVALLVFRASLRRAKVDARHVVRVAVYGCDAGLAMLVVTVAVYGPRVLVEPFTSRGGVEHAWSYGLLGFSWDDQPFATYGPLSVLAGVPVAACAALAGYRTAVAYRRYMRFDRPAATAWAAQAMAVLVAAVVIVYVSRTL